MAKQVKKKKLTKFGRLAMDVILVVSLAVAVYSGYRLFKGMSEYRKATTVLEGFRDEYTKKNEENVKEIDWEGLKAINKDIVGWIEIKDTTIDFPVVQGSDNDYYLSHLFDGTYNMNGTIFIDANNASTFSDKNTVIYGHHLLNEPWMFADLYKYHEQSFYDAHKEIDIYTPDKKYVAYPLAGFYESGAGGYIQYTFADNEDFLEYVHEFENRSTFETSESITEDDRLILLSTCEYEKEADGRFALIAKLVEEE